MGKTLRLAVTGMIFAIVALAFLPRSASAYYNDRANLAIWFNRAETATIARGLTGCSIFGGLLPSAFARAMILYCGPIAWTADNAMNDAGKCIKLQVNFLGGAAWREYWCSMSPGNLGGGGGGGSW